jgi:hypothetical protein
MSENLTPCPGLNQKNNVECYLSKEIELIGRERLMTYPAMNWFTVSL